jgi:UDP-glucose 4-epimerase
MRVGVLGSSGFIGSTICSSLGDQCCRFDDKMHSLFDVASMKDFVKNADIIFHLAGKNRAPNDEIFRVNFLGTTNLLESIRRYSDSSVRIVFASSLQVYGYSTTSSRFRETDSIKPQSIYALSKYLAEVAIKSYYEYYGLKSLVFRISNVYGEGCRPFYNSVISTFAHQIGKKEVIEIDGSGEQSRDFIHVSDVVDAFRTTLNHRFNGFDILNICTGRSVSVIDVIELIRTITDRNFTVQHRKFPRVVDYAIGDPSKAMEVLGWHAKVGLEDGLRRMIEGVR